MSDAIELFVVGAHLTGMPLNKDLLALGGRFRRAVSTVLTGASAEVATEDGKPAAALPVVEESNVGASFERAFPANSLTVLRLR